MIRKIGLIAGQNFSGWHRNARIWLTFALGLVLCLMLSDQMLTRAQTYDASIQIFEPFIWTFGDGESVLLSTLLLLVLFAALTSSISLMETAVSILRDKTGWGRKKSTILITIYVLILGTIVSLGFGPLSFIQLLGLGLLDFFDFISNSVLMPIVAILTCICVGHFIGPKVIEDEVELNGPFKIKKFYRIMLKWIAPIFLALILIFAISETMGWIVV